MRRLDTTDVTPITALMDFAEQRGNPAVVAAGGPVEPMRSQFVLAMKVSDWTGRNLVTLNVQSKSSLTP